MVIYVVIMNEEEAPGLTRWGYHLAQANGDELQLICSLGGDTEARQIELRDDGSCADSAPIVCTVGEVIRELKQHPVLDHDGYFEQQANAGQTQADALPDVNVTLRLLRSPSRRQQLLGDISNYAVRLLLVGKHGSDRGDADALLARELFEQANPTVLLLRPGSAQGRKCDRILAPARGGENACEALRLFGAFVETHGGELHPMFVEPEGGEMADAVGQDLLQKILDEAGLEPSPYILPRVVLRNNPFTAIAEAAAEEYDLLLVGATTVSTLRRALFSTVPDRLLDGGARGGLAVGVIRAAKPLSERVRGHLDRWLGQMVPQLGRDERVTLFEGLQRNSQWSFDFLALILLSTGIAALGLLQNSTAVVIGAMLVAPLMSPLLGAGLALVQGNLPLIRASGRAILLGFLSALSVGFLLGLIVPLPRLTHELAARGGPTLLDMFVALASGVAAAYCLGRPNLSAALPGVAIAAALVPPIATVGVSLSLGEAENALGAATLFSTNVVAIILGAAATFYAIGVRANTSRPRGVRWVRRTVAGLVVCAVVLALPLGAILLSQLTHERLRTRSIRADVRDQIELRLHQESAVLNRAVFGRDGGRQTLHLYVIARKPLSEEVAHELADIARAQLTPDLRLALHTELEIDIE